MSAKFQRSQRLGSLHSINWLNVECATGNTKNYVVSQETMGTYQKKVGPKLKAVLERIAADTRVMDVTEQLTHMRCVHEQSLAMYSDIFELEFADTLEGRNAKHEALRLAGMMLNETGREVINAVEKAAKITTLAIGPVDPNAITNITKQICGFVHRVFDISDTAPQNTEDEKARFLEAKKRIVHFDRMLTEELQLPSLRALGTVITPDMQVLAMDDTIPAAPPKEVED